jgi:Transglutaminase-like superfamily
MCRMIDEGSRDPYVNQLAVAIVHGGRIRQFDFEGERRAIYRWFQSTVRFFKDIAGKETLRSARETLSGRAGDCDCQTIAMGSLLKTIGHNVRIVTISSHPEAPDIFSHVFLECRDRRGRWVPMDTARRAAAYGKGPQHWYRRREWYTDGTFEDISGMGLGYLGSSFGSRGWGLRGLGAAPRRRVARRRLRGLGQNDDWETDIAQLAPAISAATTGAAQIITAQNLTPAAQVAIAQAQNPLSSIGSGTLLLFGGAFLLIMLMGKRS